MAGNKKGKKAVFNFEDSMQKLEKTVRDLESGDLTLEESLSSFESGVGLAKELRGYLEGARRRVEVLLGDDSDGRPVMEPYEEDVDEQEED